MASIHKYCNRCNLCPNTCICTSTRKCKCSPKPDPLESALSTTSAMNHSLLLKLTQAQNRIAELEQQHEMDKAAMDYTVSPSNETYCMAVDARCKFYINEEAKLRSELTKAQNRIVELEQQLRASRDWADSQNKSAQNWNLVWKERVAECDLLEVKLKDALERIETLEADRRFESKN